MKEGCVFCRIIAGEIPANILYQDDKIIAIRDIKPQAPTHILVLPKAHIPSLADLTPERGELAAHLIYIVNELAKREGIAKKGYRLVVNSGREGGQEVPHLHFHLLGGRGLSGTMG